MKKSVSIIGGGPSALALAAFIDNEVYDVSIYEKNKTTSRKFLVAGDGGFNLTHGSAIENMLQQYEPIGFLDAALKSFTNNDLRTWLSKIGIETFEGSSNRIYPLKGIKPIEVLQAILQVLKNKGVTIHTEHEWIGWNEDNAILFKDKSAIHSDITVFALGGATWKVTGSDGQWLKTFYEKGISTLPFIASNCAFEVQWSKEFIAQHAGKPLKNISVNIGEPSSKGELVITTFGLEGNAIYAISSSIQKALRDKGKALIFIDLKPMWTETQVLEKLQKAEGRTIQDKLKTDLSINSSAIQILKNQMSKEDYQDIYKLAKTIKQVPIAITSSGTLDEAISSYGGIDLNAVDEYFQLKNIPNQYCIGEMLDWNAPTGGYLLQACFSMGVFLARRLNERI